MVCSVVTANHSAAALTTKSLVSVYAGRYHEQQLEGAACIPPLQATCALLQVLFLTVNMLTGHHRQVVQATREQKHTEQVCSVIAELETLISTIC